MLQFQSFSEIFRQLVKEKTDQKAMGSFFSLNRTNTFLYRSLQHLDTERIKAGDEAHNTDILWVKMLAEHLQTA